MKHTGLPTTPIELLRKAKLALADTQLRRNMGKATQHDPRQARQRCGRVPARLGSAARGRARDQAAHAAAPRRLPDLA